MKNNTKCIKAEELLNFVAISRGVEDNPYLEENKARREEVRGYLKDSGVCAKRYKEIQKHLMECQTCTQLHREIQIAMDEEPVMVYLLITRGQYHRKQREYKPETRIERFDLKAKTPLDCSVCGKRIRRGSKIVVLVKWRDVFVNYKNDIIIDDWNESMIRSCRPKINLLFKEGSIEAEVLVSSWTAEMGWSLKEVPEISIHHRHGCGVYSGLTHQAPGDCGRGRK